MLLDTDTFTHRSFYTQALVHVHTPMLVDTNSFTHRSFDTHKCCDIQELLHTDTSTHFNGDFTDRNGFRLWDSSGYSIRWVNITYLRMVDYHNYQMELS